MTSNADDETFYNLKKVSELEIDVAALTQENSELFVLLQNERRKSKQLQSELDQSNLHGKSLKQGNIEVATGTSEEFLQNVVVMLKEQLDSKQSECEDLEDKLSLANQELVRQGEEQTHVTLEFQYQLKHLHELLAQERDLNSFLSEESDIAVRELENRMQEKDDINIELKVVQNETAERMHSMEEECRFYKEKLCETEERLHGITSEQEEHVIKMDSVSCQVSQSELRALEENENRSIESSTFYEIFRALWGKGDIELNDVTNATRYMMNIFNLIQNGFQHLGGNFALHSIKRLNHNCDCISNF